MQTIPITAGAVSDRPTIGVFGGLQIGSKYFSARPELGVFYDHSALGLRQRDVLFVPAITLMRGRQREDSYSEARPRQPRSLPRLPGLPRLEQRACHQARGAVGTSTTISCGSAARNRRSVLVRPRAH